VKKFRIGILSRVVKYTLKSYIVSHRCYLIVQQ